MKRITLLSSILYFFICAPLKSQDVTTLIDASNDHSTLRTAFHTARLTPILQGSGPFTILAPVDAAFDKLPAGSVATLLNKGDDNSLNTLLNYHIIPGRLSTGDFIVAIKQSGGTLIVETLQGAVLTATLQENKIVLKDQNGKEARILAKNQIASNGILHHIDTVLQPEQ